MNFGAALQYIIILCILILIPELIKHYKTHNIYNKVQWMCLKSPYDLSNILLSNMKKFQDSSTILTQEEREESIIILDSFLKTINELHLKNKLVNSKDFLKSSDIEYFYYYLSQYLNAHSNDTSFSNMELTYQKLYYHACLYCINNKHLSSFYYPGDPDNILFYIERFLRR